MIKPICPQISCVHLQFKSAVWWGGGDDMKVDRRIQWMRRSEKEAGAEHTHTDDLSASWNLWNQLGLSCQAFLFLKKKNSWKRHKPSYLSHTSWVVHMHEEHVLIPVQDGVKLQTHTSTESEHRGKPRTTDCLGGFYILFFISYTIRV